VKQLRFSGIDLGHTIRVNLNAWTLLHVALVMSAVLVSGWLGRYLVVKGPSGFAILLEFSLLLLLAVAIFQKPYLGLVATVASLPLLELLPSVPLATSVVSALGGLTAMGYVAQRSLRGETLFRPRLPPQHLLGLTFILWFFVTNPPAAWAGDRNWLWTYIQLWILLWLAGELLVSPDRQRVLIGIFALATLVSALFGLQEAAIGQSLRETLRGVGFIGNSNAAARYFTVGLVSLNFFRETTTKPLIRICALVAMAILLVGVVFTVSRSGLFLLIVALGLILVKRVLHVQHTRLGLLLAVSLVVVLVLPRTYWDLVRFYILPSIEYGTDTIELRYNLWEAGLRMWADHPLRGVGIGQFGRNLRFYGEDLLNPYYLTVGLGTHNMYIKVLAETGIVGLAIFVGLLGMALRSLWQATRSPDPSTSSLAWAWLIVFVIVLVGGITKDDHYDKLLWLTIGVSSSLASTAITLKEKPWHPVRAS